MKNELELELELELHRLDVVFMITRAPTRRARESRSFRDGAVPTQAAGRRLLPEQRDGANHVAETS